MSIGLPLPRIAVQTGIVLQTLRSFSAREEKLHGRQAQQSPWCAREADRRDYLLAKPNASVTEVHVEFQRSGFDLSRTTLHRLLRFSLHCVGVECSETVVGHASERVNMQKMSERHVFLMISPVGRTLFYHNDSLQNTIHTAHDLTRWQSHSVTISFIT